MSTPVHLASRVEVFEMSPSQRVIRAVRLAGAAVLMATHDDRPVAPTQTENSKLAGECNSLLVCVQLF